MVNQLTSQNQLKPMSEVLEMHRCNRLEFDNASMSRHAFIAERVMRHRAKMLDVSKCYFGLDKLQASKDSSNASGT